MVRVNVKVKSATLMETVVATVIILAVFFVSSLILNNLAQKLLANKTFVIDNRIEKLHYLYNHKIIELPLVETYGDYKIYISRDSQDDIYYVHYEVVNTKSDDIIIRDFVADE